MKTKKTLYGVSLVVLVSFLTGCSVDSSHSSTPDPELPKSGYAPNEKVLKSFDLMFPNAKNISWSGVESYDVVNFTEYGATINAWFDREGRWQLSKRDVPFGKVPTAVTQSFSKSLYANNQLKKVSFLERKDFDDVYIFQIEDDLDDANLYYFKRGDFIRETRNSSKYMDRPVSIPGEVRAFISQYHPQAQIIDIWFDSIGLKAGIIDYNTYMIIALDNNYKWLSTTVNLTEEEAPPVVMEGFKNSRKDKTYLFKEVKYAYLEQKNCYYFYFYEEGKHKVSTLEESGNHIVTVSYTGIKVQEEATPS